MSTMQIDAARQAINVSGGGSGGGNLIFLLEMIASNSAQLDFVSVITSTYSEYVLEVIDAVPATNGVNLQMRVSSDNGSTFDSGSNYMSSMYQTNQGSFSTNLNAGTTTSIILVNGAANSAGNAATGYLKLYGPNSGLHKRIIQHFGSLATDGNFYNQIGSSRWASTAIINAIRLFFSSGNIVSGAFRLYGIAKV